MREKKIKIIKNPEYRKAEYSDLKLGFHIARRSRPDITYRIVLVSNGNEPEQKYVSCLQRYPSHIIFNLTEEQLYKRDYILITDPKLT